MTRDEVFDAISPVLRLVTGYDDGHVILANPNEGAPTGPYLAVSPDVNVNDMGQARTVKRAGAEPFTVDFVTISNHLSEVSLQFYRGSANDMAKRVKNCNKRPDVSGMLFQAGVGWLRTGPINNITTLQSGQQEPRAQLSLFLMHQFEDVVTINTIERVPYTVQDEEARTLAEGDTATPGAPPAAT